jgi:epoxyqueuosine reductase
MLSSSPGFCSSKAPRSLRRIPEIVVTGESAFAAARVRQFATAAGFDLCRIASATPLHQERVRYLQWLADGRQGTMQWMTPERAERSADPTSILPCAESVVCVGMSYWAGHREPGNGQVGQVARYAWGADYHAVIGERLERLAASLRNEFGGESRWYVDTGPMMDKALAARSGLGWYGKNTNILTEDFGSFVLLGEIITTVDLPADEPMRKDCGSCRLCVVACPTGALGPEYTIDANKCISYLTIEHRGPIPVELRPAIGSWVFGCDICQDVCPPTMEPHLQSPGERRAWAREVRQMVAERSGAARQQSMPADPNTRADDTDARGQAMGPAPTEPMSPPSFPSTALRGRGQGRGCAPPNALFSHGVTQAYDLRWLLHLTHEQYLDAFRGTAIRRAKVWMLRRNAAVALGNTGDTACLADLRTALHTDEHPLVRGHAAWAVGRIGQREAAETARQALGEALATETDEDVRLEIRSALHAISRET